MAEQLDNYQCSPTCSANGEQGDIDVGRGTRLAQEGRRQEAMRLFRHVLREHPDHARAHHNLGVALAEEQNYPEALTCFQQALRFQPNYAEAHLSMGNVLGELGRHEDAVTAFRDAIHLKPDMVDALHNLGARLTRLGREKEALVYLRQAVRLRPNFPEAYNNIGLAHAERGDFAAAEVCYDQALQLNPRCRDPHTNLGTAYKEQGRFEEALACYEMALALEPDSPSTRWNRALTWLQMGDFEQGWPEYEWRWKRKEAVPRALPGKPRWDGSPLRGRTILLQVEQGFGDMIQFLRYAPLVKERGGTIVVVTPPALVALFSTCSGVDQVVPDNEDLPSFDVYAPLMSLPALLGTSLATIPANVPYLRADQARMDYWHQRLGVVAGFKVGIAWQGNPLHRFDRHRSFPLAFMEPLARVHDVSFVSLQKGAGAEQTNHLDGRFPVLYLGPELAEWTDTAALMKCLDLVICCDTSVAHLAGALGVKVWVALSTIVDWRWLLKRDDSPWYPTMRLFRQLRLGDWPDVFEKMAAALPELVARKSLPEL